MFQGCAVLVVPGRIQTLSVSHPTSRKEGWHLTSHRACFVDAQRAKSRSFADGISLTVFGPELRSRRFGTKSSRRQSHCQSETLMSMSHCLDESLDLDTCET